MLVAVKVAGSIFVAQLNATKPRSSKTQFQFQFELSLAQLSPSLFLFSVLSVPIEIHRHLYKHISQIHGYHCITWIMSYRNE